MSLPTEPALQPHRNHGLFSDHYLDVTLPKRPGWRSMVEQAQPVMEEISRHFASFTPSTNEAQTERDLVRPILKLLGPRGGAQAGRGGAEEAGGCRRLRPGRENHA